MLMFMVRWFAFLLLAFVRGQSVSTVPAANQLTVWSDLSILQEIRQEYEEHHRRNLQNEEEEEMTEEQQLGLICGWIIEIFDAVAPKNENRECSCNFWTRSIECNYKSVTCRNKVLPSLDIIFDLGIRSTTVHICQEFMESEFEQVCIKADLQGSKYDVCRKATMGKGLFSTKECSCEVCEGGMTLDVDCSNFHELAYTHGCQRVFFQDTCLDFAPTSIAEEAINDTEIVVPSAEAVEIPTPNQEEEKEVAQEPTPVDQQVTGRAQPRSTTTTPRARFFSNHGEEVTDMTPRQLAAKWSTSDPWQHNYTTTKRIQRYAMAALYFATTTYDEAWYQSDNWLSYNVDECMWFSISDQPCTPKGQLESLDLANNSLFGELNPEIGYFRSVEYLYLSYNFLTGLIPTTLGMLSKLIDLDMFASNLIGPIPSELGRLTNLEALSLADNWLNGTIPSQLGLLTNIYAIELDGNNFNGAVPVELCNLISNFGVQVFVDCYEESVQCDCGCVCREPTFWNNTTW